MDEKIRNMWLATVRYGFLKILKNKQDIRWGGNLYQLFLFVYLFPSWMVFVFTATKNITAVGFEGTGFAYCKDCEP